ncbi:MAG: protein kinase [Planctomycetes bacterium]|nr:protein kinase [Planctomycetota bacterium]
MSTSGADADDFENLLAEAVVAHERGGDTAVGDLLTRHPAHADAVRRSLQDLARSGLLRAPTTHGLYPQRLGEFQLLERIGSGGMGVVFLAEQQSLRRKVAVKIVRPELLLSDVARERFQREIETIAQLQHPGIVPIVAVGSEGGIPYFAMDYVAGKTLDDVITTLHERDPAALHGSDFARTIGLLGARTGTQAARLFAGPWWETCVRVIASVARTMAYVHARGIVHRDLKPSNVVVTPLGQTLLLDFGLAHMAHAEKLTRSGAEVGSPAYMSPEQLRGDALDERTDIYSLAVTLHQLLALELPFAGGSSDDLRRRILTGQPRPLRPRNLPRELAIVVAVAMDLDRDRRYRDMTGFAADLEAVLARQPIAARPLGLGLRLVRSCQRHPARAAAAGVAVLFSSLLPLLLWAVQRDANQQLDQALTLATADYGDARAAIERMLVDFGYSELHGIPQAEPLRANMLRTAVQYYERLATRRPDDLALMADLAVARRALGTVLREVGDQPGAVAELQAALTVLDRDDLPRHGELPMHAAIGHKALAKAFRDLGRLDDALREVAAMTACLQRLARERPNDFDTRIQSAEADNLRADLLQRANRPGDHEAALRAALASKRELLRDFPDHELAVQGVAVQCINVADALRADPLTAAEAVALYREAIATVQGRTFSAGERAMGEQLLGDARASLGVIALRAGDANAATAELEPALATRAALIRDFPTTLRHHLRYAEAQLLVADLRCRQGRFADAETLAREALGRTGPHLGDGVERAPWRSCRAEAQARIGIAMLARGQVGEPLALLAELQSRSDPHDRLAAALLAAALATTAAGDERSRAQHRQTAIAAALAASNAGADCRPLLADPVFAPLRDDPALADLRAAR